MTIIVEHLKGNSNTQQEFELDSYKLTNNNGMSATLINYGAAIAKIEVPDRNGNIADVVLGHDNLLNYVGGRFYLGATVGRSANRIKDARFFLDAKEYNLTQNKAPNMLHGGLSGFDKKFWSSRTLENSDEPKVEFTLQSPDGDEGFPGTLDVKIVYTLSDENELRIEYTAHTDKPTIVNLTNHSYFNLTGSTANTILDHILTIDADSFTPSDQGSIPTGEILSVEDTPLDFRKARRIGDRIDDAFQQLINGKGYDHNWVLNKKDTGDMEVKAASVYDPFSGRTMEVFTNQPGIQFYSGNYLDGSVTGKAGQRLQYRSGLCLECQGFPNAMNQKNFPTVTLRPEENYKQTTVYKFSVKG